MMFRSISSPQLLGIEEDRINENLITYSANVWLTTCTSISTCICFEKKSRRRRRRRRKELGNEKKCASNRETYIYNDVLLTRRFVCFIHAHKHIHKGTARTRQHRVQIDEKKYRNNSHSFFPLFCSIVCLASHIHPSIYPSSSSSSSTSSSSSSSSCSRD